jgi:hypothetical protein
MSFNNGDFEGDIKASATSPSVGHPRWDATTIALTVDKNTPAAEVLLIFSERNKRLPTITQTIAVEPERPTN